MTDENKNPSSDGVHPWLQVQLTQINGRVERLGEKLDDCQESMKKFDDFRTFSEVRFGKLETVVENHDKKLNDLSDKSGNPGNTSAVTFKWLVDKLAAPVVTSIITALLVAALVAWLTSGG